MKNQNIILIAMAFALAFAFAPVTNANPIPGGIATRQPPPSTGPEDVEVPVIKIYSAGNVVRGKTASFVLDMKPAQMFGGTYVNFSVSGTAVAGIDYVPFLSPAYIGQSGKGVISFATLPDPRAQAFRQAYSVVVTLEPGLGYALAEPKSAIVWIKPGL